MVTFVEKIEAFQIDPDDYELIQSISDIISRMGNLLLELLGSTTEGTVDDLQSLTLKVLNLNIKIGNTPDESVRTTMHHLKETVFPAARDL